MDALLLALILTLVLDQGTGSQALAARFGNGGAAGIAGLALMVAINAVVAAAMGGLIAALLTAEARLLFLAIALSFGALGQMAAPFRAAPAERPEAGPIRTLILFALRRAGENGAFAVAGVAAFTGAPILAGLGGALGGWAALVPPLLSGRRPLRHGFVRGVRLLSGLVLLIAGIWCAATALRLT